MNQIWISGVDAAGILCEIGGWHVGCQNHVEAQNAVDWLDRQGYLARRVHFAPAIPEGVIAFDITDAGLDAMSRWGWESGRQNAERRRQWYRDREVSPGEKGNGG